MARSKSTPATALKVSGSPVEATEFILSDFRVSKTVSERFCAPEEAKIGTFSVHSETHEIVFPSKTGPLQLGKLTFSLELIGKRKEEDEESPDGKSFSVKISAEGLFEVHGPLDLKDETKCGVLIVPIIDLMYALCVQHGRAEADSMGYRSVRPSYQVRNRTKPILEHI